MWDLIVSVPDHCLSFYFSDLDLIFKVTLALFIDTFFICCCCCVVLNTFLMPFHCVSVLVRVVDQICSN